MVKNALRSRYQQNEIDTDQYTNINRDVSRKLYEQIGDAESLADQVERERWQTVATVEVDKAIEGIKHTQHDGDDNS